ncbi:ATP-binding protein [Neomoorella humiferrea]|uniref:ATP-binding protein n=1 Tax=Neomoorella humiferrea TaxID=676965 RepID=UPI003BAEFF67
MPASCTITILSTLAFLEWHENVLALGAVGTGKTRLTTALGLKACMEDGGENYLLLPLP